MTNRNKKKKRRKLSLTGIAFFLFTFSLVMWLLTSLFVNTRNTSLTMKIQSMNEELALLKSQNQTLSYEIQTLENKDRVFAAAQLAQLDQVSDNIISIGD